MTKHNSVILYLILVYISGVVNGFCTEDVKYTSQHFGKQDGSVYSIQYGFKNTNLVFVVFNIGTNQIVKKTSIPCEVRRDGFYVMSATLLDGERKINLLANGGCYENVAGIVQKKELNFTLLELERFLKSEPARFTVEDLNIYQKKGGKKDQK